MLYDIAASDSTTEVAIHEDDVIQLYFDGISCGYFTVRKSHIEFLPQLTQHALDHHCLVVDDQYLRLAHNYLPSWLKRTELYESTTLLPACRQTGDELDKVLECDVLER